MKGLKFAGPEVDLVSAKWRMVHKEEHKIFETMFLS